MVAHRRNTPTTDCTCTPPRPHGDQHVYQVHRCGCDACRDGYQRYLAERRDARAAGHSLFVPVGPAQAHLHALAEAGVPIRLTAERLGYSSASLYSISRAARPTCRREVADAVLAQPIPRSAEA